MFGSKTCVKCAAALVAAALLTMGSVGLEAQILKRRSHQTNATRRERVQRTLEETYSHRYELAGGGGYLRFRTGQTLQKINEYSWWMTGTRYLNPKLGIVGDARGYYGNAKIGNNALNPNPDYNVTIPFNPQISQYNFMGGVNYRFYRQVRYAASVFVVGGVARGNFDGDTKGYPSYYVHMWQSGIRPTVSVGANFDYNVYPNLAIRVAPTWVGNMFSLSPNDQNLTQGRGSVQNNLGFNAGIVYRFGRNK